MMSLAKGWNHATRPSTLIRLFDGQTTEWDAEQCENFLYINVSNGNIKLLPCALQFYSSFNSISLTLMLLLYIVGRFPSFPRNNWTTFHLSLSLFLAKKRTHIRMCACFIYREMSQIHINCLCVLVCLRFFNEWMRLYLLCEHHTALGINPFPMNLVIIYNQDNFFLLIFFASIVNSVYYNCIKWKHVFFANACLLHQRISYMKCQWLLKHKWNYSSLLLRLASADT